MPRAHAPHTEPRAAPVPKEALLLNGAAWLLIAGNLVLLGYALWLGPTPIRDGDVRVTTGYLTAATVGLAFLIAAVLPFARRPPRLTRHLQVLVLASMVLHGLGHLARLYYELGWYDVALHFGLVLWFAVLAVGVARAYRVIPKGLASARRAALVALFAGLAASGVWELLEYGVDLASDSREQDHLPDTMGDMAAGFAGAVVAAVAAYREPGRIAAVGARRRRGERG